MSELSDEVLSRLGVTTCSDSHLLRAPCANAEKKNINLSALFFDLGFFPWKDADCRQILLYRPQVQLGLCPKFAFRSLSSLAAQEQCKGFSSLTPETQYIISNPPDSFS